MQRCIIGMALLMASACSERPLVYVEESTSPTPIDLMKATPDMQEQPVDMAAAHVCDMSGPELCNGVDDNCNGLIDENCPSTMPGNAPLLLRVTGADSDFNPTFWWSADRVLPLLGGIIVCGPVTVPLPEEREGHLTVILPNHSFGVHYLCQMVGAFTKGGELLYSNIVDVGY